MSSIKNSINNKLIDEVIEASICFEELMDKIDFNSFLLEEESNVKKTRHYNEYTHLINEAYKTIDNIPKEALENEIIEFLFTAKKYRLEARKQIDREKEKEKFIDAVCELQKAIVKIDVSDLRGSPGRNIYDKRNWAKLLIYNEMAICYSGLEEPSISLGYAERSISLLKKIHPKINDNIKNKKLEKLSYSFALFNKGEAERLLNNYDESLITFEKIIKVYKKNWSGKKPSDYYTALLRIALILIDSGRGEEAIADLNIIKNLLEPDYRIQNSDLEKIRAYIDMKKYRDALKELDEYLGKEWEGTFINRKAKVDELRLINEFIYNRQEEFEKNDSEISQKINKKYIDFKKNAEKLLSKCSEKRRDAINFKKTCSRLADYFHELKERSTSSEDIKTNRIYELKSYYLYLCSKVIFEGKEEFLDKLKPKDIIEDWITKHKKKLAELINDYNEILPKNSKFVNVIEKINDEYYLKRFFTTYIEFDENDEDTFPSEDEQNIIKSLNKRLIDLLSEKDNINEAEKLKEKFDIYEEKIKEKNKEKNKSVTVENDCEKFIQNCFFEGVFFSGEKKETTCLTPDSIINKMQQNTKNFTNSVVEKTNRFPKEEKFKGIFTVLRRWNSFTPALTSSINKSKGGGYFIYFSYKDDPPIGIVLDPGYNFLENLLSSGYCVGNINAVIISHAHPDHTDNLPSILSLFHEANNRLGKHYYKKKSFNKKQLKLIISQGVFDQYHSGFIKPSQESLEDIVVVTSNSKNPCFSYKFNDKYSIQIDSFPTYHEDLMKKRVSLGFIIKIKNKNKDIRKIGYTSDAHWKKDFYKNKFQDCNTLFAHLGSIVDILGGKEFCSLCGNFKKINGDESNKCKSYLECSSEKFRNGKVKMEKLIKQAQEQKHLYLSGLTMLFDDLLPKDSKDNNKKLELAIISEFGEELKGGVRMDLYHKFDDWFQKSSNNMTRCFPGDIGLEIDLMNNNIFCCCCQEFKSKDYISPITYGEEEAIFFICNECKSVFSSYEIEEKLMKYNKYGRKLELADE